MIRVADPVFPDRLDPDPNPVNFKDMPGTHYTYMHQNISLPTNSLWVFTSVAQMTADGDSSVIEVCHDLNLSATLWAKHSLWDEVKIMKEVWWWGNFPASEGEIQCWCGKRNLIGSKLVENLDIISEQVKKTLAMQNHAAVVTGLALQNHAADVTEQTCRTMMQM